MPAADPALQGYEAYRARSHFAALDGLRFCAIIAVLFMHSPLATVGLAHAPFFGRGFLGVDLFFVISGFLITTLLLREEERKGHISLRGFYWRRVLRIFPLYLLLVTLAGGYYVLVKQMPGMAERWPFYYLFMANFLSDHIPLLGPTWSLAVEEQYYMLWPLLLVVVPRRWLLPGIVVFVTVYILATFSGLRDQALTLGPLQFKLEKVPYVAILLGSGLALLLHRRAGFEALWHVLGHRWASVLLGVVLLIQVALLPGALLGWPLLLIHLTMTAFLGSLVLREDTPLMPVLRFAPIVRVGVVSYGIYLLHLVAYFIAHALMTRLLGYAPTAASSAGVLAVYITIYWGLSWAMAEVSYRFYESHFLALRHKPLGFVARASTRNIVKGKSSS